MSVGGDDFLSKPIRPRHLVNTITNRVQRAHILKKQHHHPNSRDLLTGLYNRRHFYEQLDQITTQIQDRATTGGVLYISIQQAGNDSLGPENDDYFANMGSLIGGLLEEQDIAARIDDDSIAILILRPHQKNIISLAENLAHKLIDLKSGAKLTPYIGIATFGSEQSSASDLIANASAASQDIQGSDRYVNLYIGGGDSCNRTDASELPDLFKQALHKRSFQLFFRALTHTQKAGTKAYDVKPRLLLPDGRQLGSSEIMSLADTELLGTQVSQWLIERTLVTLEEKRAEGKNNLLMVTQSSESIFQGTTTSWLRDQLRARQMVGVGLVLEYRIAELSIDLKATKEHFVQLQEMGIKVSLSRFGASSTALKVLHYLDADFVRLAGPVLTADNEEISGIVVQIRKSGTDIILPAVTEPGSISSFWLESADWVPATSGNSHY